MLILHILNDGTGDRYGAYEYDVLVNGEVIAQGRVTGHDRLKGWPDLVRMIGEHGQRE